MQISSYSVWWSPGTPDKRSGQGQANDDNEQRPCFQNPASGVVITELSVMTSC
jgi:hypothetical protein